MQYWCKEAFIFTPEKYGLRYAALPTGVWIAYNILRIFFSDRNDSNQSNPYFVDFDVNKLKIIGEPQPVFIGIGELGSFDDSGIMPTSFLKMDDELWMYYIGWNLGLTVPFRNSIGLAISKDNGLSFQKAYLGPILDRTKDEPFFTASNCVLLEKNIFL
jgi:hypothetical protein